MDVLRHRRFVKELYQERYERRDPFEVPRLAPILTPVDSVQERPPMVSQHLSPTHSNPSLARSTAPVVTSLPHTPVKSCSRAQPASPALSEASAYTASAVGSPTKTPRHTVTQLFTSLTACILTNFVVPTQIAPSNSRSQTGYIDITLSHISNALHRSRPIPFHGP